MLQRATHLRRLEARKENARLIGLVLVECAIAEVYLEELIPDRLKPRTVDGFVPRPLYSCSQ